MIDILRHRLDAEGTVAFAVRVRPGARVTAWKDALEDGTLKIDVAATPEDGEANAELMRFLAESFGVARSLVVIVSGHTSRRKIIRVDR